MTRLRIAIGAAIASVLLLGPTPALAQPTAWPGDSLYKAVECASANSFDPLTDEPGGNKERDIVGDSTYPALYLYDCLLYTSDAADE